MEKPSEAPKAQAVETDIGRDGPFPPKGEPIDGLSRRHGGERGKGIEVEDEADAGRDGDGD